MKTGLNPETPPLRRSSNEMARHLLDSAKNLAKASAAAVVFVRNSVSRVILASGTECESASYFWPNDYWPYEPDRVLVVQMTDKVDLQLARAIRTMLGDYQAGTFIRLPALITRDYTVALALCGPRETCLPTAAIIELLKGFAASIATEMRAELSALTAVHSERLVPIKTGDLLNRVRNDNRMRCVMDKELSILAVSPAILREEAFNSSQDSCDIALLPKVVIPNSLRLLLQNTLGSGVTSPVVEMRTTREGKPFSFSIRATPIRALDASADVLDLTFTPLPAVPGRPDLMVERRSTAADASCNFLFESLVARSSLHTRKNASYITLRAWRSSIKKHQILALKSIKRSHPAEFASRVGEECAAEIKRLVGGSSFKYVVPVPCGNSEAEKCLASAIAREVASRLGLLNINAFAHLGGKGSSHPKDNLRRARLRLMQEVPGPAILVDDVATSGSHIAEAIECLGQAGTETFALAWIGGEARDI